MELTALPNLYGSTIICNYFTESQWGGIWKSRKWKWKTEMETLAR